MANVYSTLFAQQRFVGEGLTILATVPAGELWIVRDVVLYVEFDVDTAQLGVLVEDPAAGYCYLYREMTPTPGQTYHWDGRQVMTVGQSLECYHAAATSVVRVSGYRFTVPA